MKSRIFVTFILSCCSHFIFAQNDNPDFFRSTGKIYVVVAVLIIIFFGIILFLINLDRKLTRLEKEVKKF